MNSRISYTPLLRVLLSTFGLGRTLRWRHADQPKSIRPDQVREMLEDLIQHGGSMVMIGRLISIEAKGLNDETHDGIDWIKFEIMCMLHDIEEVLIGDARSKDAAYYVDERWAKDTIFIWLHEQLPYSAAYLKQVLDEYHERKTVTARFVKVLDELQAWLYMIYTRGFDETSRDFTDLNQIEGYRLSEPFVTTRQVMNLAAKVIRRPGLITSDIAPMPYDT